MEYEIIDVKLLQGNILNISFENNRNIILSNINKDLSVEFNVKNDINVRLSMVIIEGEHHIDIKGSIAHNSHLSIYVADLCGGQTNLSTDINLNGTNSYCDWHLASLSQNRDKKIFDVSIKHNVSHCESLIDNYGVCKDESKIVFAGTCHIKENAVKSVAHQNAKIIVFDNNCVASAKPILKIDNNDIEASHAAAVGKVNEEQLFYLTTRGISKDKARELITFGYLKPILYGFDNESIRNSIALMIEEGI